MKIIDFEHNGTTYHLCMNAAALFDIYAKFGSENPVLSHIQDMGKKGFEAVCWMLWKLAEQGELVRRWQGHRPEPIPREGQFRALLAPDQASEARLAIAEAVKQGFAREISTERPDCVDLGLQQLKAAQGGGDKTLSEYLDMATQVLGLNVGDAMRMTPGQVHDLVALELRRGRLRKAE